MIIEIVIHSKMKNTKHLYIALTSIAILILICGCRDNDWTTRYSGKYDPKGNKTTIVEGPGKIILNLDKEGASILGPCGLNPRLLASYDFYLTPIKKEYKDEEIHMQQISDDSLKVTTNFVDIKPIIGSISFNEDFSKATVDIKVLDSNKQFIDFAGNGVHKIKN